MITTKLYLDKRGTPKDEKGTLQDFPCQIKLSITKHGRAAYIPLGVRVTPSQWDTKSQKIVKHPNMKKLNFFLEMKKTQIDGLIQDLSIAGKLTLLSSTQIKNEIEKLIDPKAQPDNLFISRFIKFSESRPSERTRELYAETLRKIEAYDKESGALSFEQIKKQWIIGFSEWMERQGLSKNTRNIHLRNIRSVFNDAIDNEITQNYPLRKVDIRPETTRNRALPTEDLRRLFSIKVEKWQQRYVDYFKLTFYLIGINTKDLLSCTINNVQDGRLVYRRAKTGRMYSIKIEPEAMQLIEKYRGDKLLVNFGERYKDYRSFTKKLDRCLKTIGPVILKPNPKWAPGKVTHKYIKHYLPEFPKLSMYYARYTWANIAYSLEIPDETIAAALGHGHGNQVTAIYIDKSIAKIDEANRKVIDFVLKGLRDITSENPT